MSRGTSIRTVQTNTPLGSGAEFDIIRDLIAEWGDTAFGIGDDGAILATPAGQQVVVSTDATVEDVHFRRKWISVHDAGARAATAALSDLAAMGATPNAVLVSLIVPTVWREHLREFARGLGVSVAAAGARIVGGNMSRGAAFSCTLTVIGHAAAPVRRDGAQEGDELFVTGIFGGPGRAVEEWERHAQPEDWAVQRFIHPVARLKEGCWLSEAGATAMIDVSDGLAADARHLAAASGGRCIIQPELVPRFDAISAEDAMESGEEYELLVAMPRERSAGLTVRFQSECGVPLTRVGWVERADVTHTASNTTERVEIHPGHDHFSG